MLCLYYGGLVFVHVLVYVCVCVVYVWYEKVVCVGATCLVCNIIYVSYVGM